MKSGIDDILTEVKSLLNRDEHSGHRGISDILKGMRNGPFAEDEEEASEPVVPSYTPEYTLPPVTEEESKYLIERYWLYAPFSYAKISVNSENDLRYEITEPYLNRNETLLLEEVYEQLKTVLVYDSPRKRKEMKVDDNLIRKIILSFMPEITEDRISILIYYLRRNFTGYGILDPLMHDLNIEDITCNGSEIPVYIYHRKYNNIPTNLRFENIKLNKYVLKLAQMADKQISLTTPLVDAALPGGARAQITYSDIVSSNGSSFTIRKFKADPMTPVDLISLGTYDPEIMALLWLAVENGKSMIIVGGTASGKTSTMNAVSFFIPPFAKIVSLEDTREIKIPNENWLAMKTRETGIIKVNGDVDMFSLLKSALRQRPEYIIVGEVRGEEAQTLFQAMNTGHTTYSTLHAGGVSEAINRLTHEPINVPVAMFGALDLMLIQSLQYDEGHGMRRCLSLNEISTENGEITWNVLYEWNPHTDEFERRYKTSKVLDEIAYSHGWSEEKVSLILARRNGILRDLCARNITGMHDISHYINEERKATLHDSL